MPLDVGTMLMRSWLAPEERVRLSRMFADELYAEFGDVPLLPWLRVDLALRGSENGRARADAKEVVRASDALRRQDNDRVPFLSRLRSEGTPDANPR